MEIETFKEKYPHHIVLQYKEYIIIAQDSIDYQMKMRKIDIGDVDGFYKING